MLTVVCEPPGFGLAAPPAATWRRRMLPPAQRRPSPFWMPLPPLMALSPWK
jgi:hypothetical protein